MEKRAVTALAFCAASLFGNNSLSAASAATHWVAPPPLGDDANPGTREQPWATPHKAVASVAPGDVVLFRGGTYPLTSRVEPAISGTNEAWITFAGYPGERAVFDGAGYTPKPNELNRGLVHVEFATHIRLRNLHVRNSHGHGIMVRAPSAHVEIVECSVEETFGPGIGLWYGEHVKVQHCEVTRTNTNRMRLYGDPQRQAIHEAISTEGAKHFEIAFNHVHRSDKEGIDIKGPSAHGVVHHNYVHHMPRQGLYADAWFGVLEDVEFHHNVVHDCEWGIAIATEGANSEVRNVRIHHNLFHHNRGSGLFFALWNDNGPRRNVVVAHNTFFANGSARQFSGPTGNIDLRSRNIFDISVFNNLCVAGGTFEIGTFADPDNGGREQLAAQNIRITHNFIGAFRPIAPDIAALVVDGSPQHQRYGRSYATAGDAPILGDAALAAPVRGSFYLTAASAARSAGRIDPVVHPGGATTPPDVGAFAFREDAAADPAPVLEHAFENVWRVVQPTFPGRVYRRLESTDGGVTWTAALQPCVGNYVPDIHTFEATGDSTPMFKYHIQDLAAEPTRLPDFVPVVDGDWWQIASEDFDAGAASNKPAPGEPVRSDHQQVSDFTIFQAADGTWQLVSAVRRIRAPGKNPHLLFRWESPSLTTPHWEEKGILWTTETTPDASYTAGIIYAPHCIRHDGTFYMFHNSGGVALVLTSRDGKNFEQARNHEGDDVFFPTGEAGRDLMIFDNRARDGLWYAYYAGMDRSRPELEVRRWHEVYARTARDLRGPWSERFVVGLGTPDRPADDPRLNSTFVNTESPFVFFDDGFFFKLEQTNIVASRSPRDFGGAPIVGTLYPDFRYPDGWWPGLAPEIVEHDGRLYVALFQNHGDRPLAAGGIFMAPLRWVPRASPVPAR